MLTVEDLSPQSSATLLPEGLAEQGNPRQRTTVSSGLAWTMKQGSLSADVGRRERDRRIVRDIGQ